MRRQRKPGTDPLPSGILLEQILVAVAVQARRRDQCGEMVDELERGEGQRSASVALWLRQTIDDPVFVDLFDPALCSNRT